MDFRKAASVVVLAITSILAAWIYAVALRSPLEGGREVRFRCRAGYHVDRGSKRCDAKQLICGKSKRRGLEEGRSRKRSGLNAQ